jgi:glycosyltransferase involved in cell wall biosynthesis
LRKKNVLMIVTNPFKPDERVRREAETLANLGYDITVVAWDREAAYPITEEFSGFSLRRIRLRSLYSSFPAVLVTLPVFWAAAFAEILTRDVDVIHCHDLDTLPLGIVAKFVRKRVKTVYDAHEHYSSMIADFVPSPIRAVIATIERLLPRKADAVLTVNEMLAERIQNRNVFVVRNTPDSRRGPISGNSVSSIEWPRGFRILFYGFLIRDRGIETILRIASQHPNLSIVMAGDGPLVETVKQAASKLQNLKFLGYVSQEEIRRLLTECDLVYLVEDPRIENNRIASPSRLYQAMMFGKPVIAARGCYMGQVALRERCGILATYDDLSDILSAILRLEADRRLVDLLGSNGKTVFEEKYRWQFSAKALEACYDSILHSQQPTEPASRDASAGSSVL